MERQYSVTIVPDDEEKFTPSTCVCKDCDLTHKAQLEWDTFTSKTHLQKRMKQIVDKIEKDINLYTVKK